MDRPGLRTEAQPRVLGLDDPCGLGINYLDFDNLGDVKAATEVSLDNFALTEAWEWCTKWCGSNK